MKEKPYVLDFQDDDKPIALKDVVSKYLRYWPWFVGSIIFFLVAGVLYSAFAPVTYKTVAKIKILDDTVDSKVISDAQAVVNRNIRLNLENHVEVLKSFRLLNTAASELRLDVSYYKMGSFFYDEIWNPPFVVSKNISDDLIEKPLVYTLEFSSTGFNIEDEKGVSYIVPYAKSGTSLGKLPFHIELAENTILSDYANVKYKIKLSKLKNVTLALAEALNITTSEKESDILNLSLTGPSREKSEAILNAIIINFDKDGIVDRQLVSKRTLEVIDKRFIYLAQELDSIEEGKKDFKQAGNLSYIESDAGMSLQRKSQAEQQVLQLETQASLSKLLKETVAKESDYDLLPADIGLSNSGLNEMVSKYNEVARERQKLITSVGVAHPKIKGLSEQLELGKLNILNTVNVYQSQLNLSLRKLGQERNRAGDMFSRLPEQEKLLRSIERQQSIKENLYLLLLKKREEAAINYAAIPPSVKVIDYGLTSIKPLWPKKVIIYPLSLLLGLLIPLSVLFVRFAVDTKVHDRTDIENLNPKVPVLIEIPYFKNEKSFADVNDRSILAESFRILSTNVDYLIEPKVPNLGKVVFMTSAVKEEGKTLMALNLSLAYASMGKRVLLVGADLRNPQLHTYFKLDKNTAGLSDYLMDHRLDFYDCINDGFGKNASHKVYLSGSIPANAPVILSSKRFAEFMDRAKKEFDYVIVDTAPTMLVTDTLLIAKYADVTLFAVRSGLTDKKVLEFSKGLSNSKKLHNMAYILNAVGSGNGADYNYGYGYGYSNSEGNKPWYKRSKAKHVDLKKSA
ncbi:MAG: GumC family protein [Flavobacteriaceae bacterium]